MPDGETSASEHVGRLLSWVLQPVMLLGGGLVTGGQVFTVRFIDAAFRKSGDPAVRDLDVGALVGAASVAFPGWFRPVVVVRFVLATVGSVVVIVLLSLPQVGAHFR